MNVKNNKNEEQTKIKNLKRDKGEITDADRILKAGTDSQEHHTIHYTDFNGKKHSKRILLTDPGGMTAMEAENYANTGNDRSDTVSLYQLLMDKVVTEPSLSFEREDKKLTDSMKTKNIHTKNVDGKRVTIRMKFPDVRTAVSIINVIVKPSGANNLVQTLKTMDGYMIKDKNGRAVSDDYWNPGHDGHGLMMVAINNAAEFLADVLNHDGYLATMAEASSFLMGTVRQ